MRAASACASSSSASAGTTRDTKPMRCASAASMMSPVSRSSAAFDAPTMRGSNQYPVTSALSPIFTKSWPKRACSDARRMSHSTAMSIPMPSATPFTAATVGVSSASMPRTSGVIGGVGPGQLGQRGLHLRPAPRLLHVVAGTESASLARDHERPDVAVGIGRGQSRRGARPPSRGSPRSGSRADPA